MPLILSDQDAELWLSDLMGNDREKILSIVKPYTESELQAHTVKKIRQRGSNTNIPEITQQIHYPELGENDDKPEQGKLL